ncbi:hypothetical protein [Azohydromonas aeria]|uniref:hypothetical protein n=1 Tax=Azohydromonas aeria TaxID=2590212 RepID=UPI0012F99FE2|nr:hypothetical protein [Azohydromonas aeria]
MNPFAELQRVAERGYADRLPPPREPEVIPARLGSRTELLLHALAEHGDLSTIELSEMTGLCSKRIWGLLKAHIDSGRVVVHDKVWRINREWPAQQLQRDLARAAELLRQHGYTVTAPGARP